jgi:hypothetical protein
VVHLISFLTISTCAPGAVRHPTTPALFGTALCCNTQTCWATVCIDKHLQPQAGRSMPSAISTPVNAGVWLCERSKRIGKRGVASEPRLKPCFYNMRGYPGTSRNQVLPHRARAQTMRNFNLRASSCIRPAIPKLWFLSSNKFLSRNLPKVIISYCDLLSHNRQEAAKSTNTSSLLSPWETCIGLFAIFSILWHALFNEIFHRSWDQPTMCPIFVISLSLSLDSVERSFFH